MPDSIELKYLDKWANTFIGTLVHYTLIFNR